MHGEIFPVIFNIENHDGQRGTDSAEKKCQKMFYS